MADYKGKVPVWDGRPQTFLNYTEDVEWYISSLQSDKRKFAVGRLVSDLAPSVKALVRKWRPSDFEKEDGAKLFLDRLRASPLVRQPLPDADVMMERWKSFIRRQGENIGDYLVRENNVHEEFIAAMIKLKSSVHGTSAAAETPHHAATSPLQAASDGGWPTDAHAE